MKENLKTSGIYKIVNVHCNDFYIGSSKHIYKRWHQHKYYFRKNKHPNKILQNIWNKYGENSLLVELVEECDCIKEKLVEREQFYIDTLKPKYNILPTAGNCLGVKRSEETKKKLSEALKGRKLSDEAKENMRVAAVGRKHSEETKKKLSDSLKGKPKSEETKRKMSEAQKNMPEETKKKLSEAHKGKPKDYDVWNKGKQLSDELKKKLSNAHIGKTLAEEHKINISRKIKEFWTNLSDEDREKRKQIMSEKAKNYWLKKKGNEDGSKNTDDN